MSFDRLQEKIDSYGNPTVVGIDPTLKLVPEHILKTQSIESAYIEYSKALIDALYDIVPAVKPQAAYFEALGPQGFAVLQEVAAYAAEKGMYVILDAKRGDIGSTAEAYAEAYLGKDSKFTVDAMTINPYLGSDGILPFYKEAVDNDKAVFVLVKTSNPSSGELQDLDVGGKPAYMVIGELIERLSADSIGKYGYSRLGAVAGATYPDELRAVRERLGGTFLLVPGYGTQGGAAADVCGAFDKNGRGAVINSSRAIIGAWQKTGHAGLDFAQAARDAALLMRENLRSELGI